MLQDLHVAARIALLQVFTVILGVFLTRGVFARLGYPNEDLDWNTTALLVRDYGYFLLLVPAIWTTVSIYLENSLISFWSRRWTLASGLVFLLFLAAILLWSCLHTYHWHMEPLRAL